MGDSGDAQTFAGQAFRQVVTRGVAFHIGAECHDDLLYAFSGDTFFQFSDPQIVRFDTIQRRNLAAQNMIFASKRTGFFHAEDIHRPLDETHQAGVAPRVAANVTNGLFSQRTAEPTKANAFARLEDCLC